ncbi:MAG: ferrous iron transport protein B [Infirmifilum sp.]
MSNPSRAREIVVALAGSPNVGKSTLFNILVGANRFVGNWPGKTVDKYEGFFEHMGYRIRVVDLPGTYSLNALTEEEAIARDYIVSEKPDVIVVVANAVSLETSLYLAVQTLELYDKVIVAINKIDAASRRGIHINTEKISRRLGVPVVAISALKREGIHELTDYIIQVAEGKYPSRKLNLDYGGLGYYAKDLVEALSACKEMSRYPLQWAALRLLEGDVELEQLIKKTGCSSLQVLVEETRKKIEQDLGDPAALITASVRYDFIGKLVAESVTYTSVAGREFTETLDKIFLHPLAGPLASLLLIFAVLVLVLSVNTGFPIKQILELTGNEELAQLFETYTLSSMLSSLFDTVSQFVSDFMTSRGAPPFLISLITEGIIGGVGAVLTFLPLIFIVFVAFGFLEDTGLMARIATVYHGLMSRLGASGKALMPLLLGFGCNVPAIMGTKILDTDKEKILVSMIAPLIPCQARLVILLFLASAIPAPSIAKIIAVLAVYAYSLLLVAVAVKIASRLMGGGAKTELILELPPYHRPSLKVIWWYAWDNTLHFLKKAGTIIFMLTILVWALLHTGPQGYVQEATDSYARSIGEAITPLTSLIGIQSWQISLALITGFIAKEAVASTLIVMTGATNPSEAVRSLALTPAQLASLMIFTTVYTPCLATVSAFHAQFRDRRLTLILVLYTLIIGTLSASLVYHLLSLVMLG